MKYIQKKQHPSFLSIFGFLLIFIAALTGRVSSQPAYDHVVVVFIENHSYQEVAGTGGTNFPVTPLPFINDFLRAGGADMTNSFGLQHPSQPNYYWLFSGSNQGIVDDTAPTGPFTSAPNLYYALTNAGKTFGGYLDAYPGAANLYVGQTNVSGNVGNETAGTNSITYATRHAPWLGFSNVAASVTKNFVDFGTTPAEFSNLPTVSFVIPSLQNDMHDYSPSNEVSNVTNSAIAMTNANAWLEKHIKPYAEWAKTNNSLLILTTDEDSTADWLTPPLPFVNYHGASPAGLTSPDAGPSDLGTNINGFAQSGPNQITTIFYGADVVPGTYSNAITHVNVLRTIEWIYGLPTSGAQSTAVTSIGNGPLTAIFAIPEPSTNALVLLALAGICYTATRKKHFFKAE